MDVFHLVTPFTYWLLIVVWAYIFIFYVREFRALKNTDRFFKVLLIILAIDAFRTLFESIYFGAWYTSLSTLIPIDVYDFLAQPSIVFIPKSFNLIASLLIFFIIIQRWLPTESRRFNELNTLLAERNKTIEKSNELLMHKAQVAEEKEAQYRALFEYAPNGILIADQKSYYLDANKSMCAMLGLSHEELVGLHARDIVVSTEIEQISPALKKILAANDYQREWVFKRKDGTTFHAEVMVTTMPDKSLMAIVRDLTQQKEVETSLIESGEYHKTLFTQSTNGLALTTMDGKLVDVNAAFASIIGCTVEEALNRSYWDLTPESYASQEQEQLENLKQFKQYSGYEKEYIHKLGHLVPVRLNGRIIERKGIDYIWSSIEDITEQRKTDQQLKEMNLTLEKRVNERTQQIEIRNKELADAQEALLNIIEDLNETTEQLNLNTQYLESANKELESFSYSVSHDLRAPLRAINGFSKFLMEDYEALLDDEGKRLIKIIRDNATNMDQLISDLLRLTKVSRNELNFKNIDMTELAISVYNEMVLSEEPNKIQFSMQSLPSISADSVLIRQVWTNLISNAIKYTRPVTDRKISISYKEHLDKIVYLVKDNGVGFNPEYKHKLFGIFQRLHKVEDFEGSGVGLAIVERVISKHGGQVWAEGEVGKGACIYFSLPLKIKM